MQSCSCIFSAVGRASSIFEKSIFLFIGCYLFRRFLSDHPCRFTGAPVCPFPFIFASSPKQLVGTTATGELPVSRESARVLQLEQTTKSMVQTVHLFLLPIFHRTKRRICPSERFIHFKHFLYPCKIFLFSFPDFSFLQLVRMNEFKIHL